MKETLLSLTIILVSFISIPIGAVRTPSIAITDGPADSWHMFKGDLSHSGYSSSPAPNVNTTVWTFQTGWSVFSPVVSDGMVFFGSYDNNVYAVNQSTGAPVWSYTTGSLVCTSPAVADGKVFIGSADRRVYALDKGNGSLIWSHQTGDIVSSSPAVAHGKVFVGSDDGKLYALNQTTGSLVWSYTTGDIVGSSPAVSDGKVFFGSRDGWVYSLNQTTGALIWKFQTQSFVFSSPAVVNGRVFVGSYDGNVYALNQSTGTRIWSYRTGGYVSWTSPSVAYGKVFIGSSDGKIYALNETTGALTWSFQTGEYIVSSPAVADDKVFIGSTDHNFYALNQISGSLIWSYNAGAPIDNSSPAIASGMVFVGASNIIYAFTPDTTSPQVSITSPKDGSQVKSSIVTVVWNGSDVGSGVHHYEMKMDAAPWTEMVTTTSYTYIELSEGSHTFFVKVFDKGGNSFETSSTFYVNTSLIGGPGMLDDTAVAGVIIAVIIGAVYSTRKLQKREETK